MSALAFASPYVLLAAAALVLPYLAHLGRHEDREGRGFPSLMFLQRVPFPSRARRRLQDRALLLLRALAVLVLVLAFAGPDWPREADPVGDAARDTVVVLDVSYSMGPEARFEDARDLARATLDDVGPGGRVALVVFDDDARVETGLDAGRAQARAALSRVSPGYRGTDYAAALRRAEQVLANGGGTRGRVVLVSDLQRAGLVGEPALARDIDLEILVVPELAGGNLSLTDARLTTRSRDGGHVLHARVRNTGGVQMDAGLSVTVNELEAVREPVSLSSGAGREFTFPLFAAERGVTRIGVSLDDDALPADNRRFLVLSPPRAVSALLVSEGEADPYVSAALALASRPPVRLRHGGPGMLSAAALEDVDLLILDGEVGRDAPVRDAVARRAVSGMGLLVFASAAGGESLFLPGVLGDVLTSPPGGLSMWPVGSARAPEPVLGSGVVSVGPVWRRVALEPALEDRVLARFDDGAPALLSRRVGRGRSVLLATAPGRGWSEFGRRPEFAPWLLRSVAWLMDMHGAVASHTSGNVVDPVAMATTLERQVAGGEAIAEALERGEALRVGRADGTTETAGEGALLSLDEPGFYQLRAGAGPPVWLAVSVPAEEARREVLDVEAFKGRLRRSEGAGAGAGDGVSPSPAPGPAADPVLARWLAIVGALLLLAEGLVAALMARSRGRGNPRSAPA